ncbi:MAG: PIN domain-containing protein [Chloroflexi bacterium]|nr:PIN domain-containing protein [Chloroflexota bacterium]
MSSTIDANVLIHGANRDSPFHDRARTFVESNLTRSELVYLFWPTALAYLRISTHPSIFKRPQSAADATANIADLLRRPNIRSVGEGDRFWPAFLEVAAEVRPIGDLVPDAHIVALMRENAVRTIWTQDRGFRRFDGIETRDPFA